MAWRDDGSGNLTVSGAKVSFTGSGNSKGNAIWSQGGTGSWEFKVTGSSGTWVGVSAEDKFAAGWGMKGLFYGGPGNLSDGSSLVTSRWGPKFGDGDVIGMRLEQTGDKTVLAFSKNGSGLGVAFDISGYSGKEFRPAVSMDEPGQGVTISETATSSLDAFQLVPTPRQGVEGDWQGRFKLMIEKTGEGAWHIAAEVANIISCDATLGADGKLVPGPVMSTMMMPPPELQQLENEATSILEGLSSLRREGETLVLEGGGKKEIFTPAAGPGSATKDRVNWMC